MSIEIKEVRNAQYVSPRGDIDLEINHPDYGWIQYTMSLDDEDNTIDNAEITRLAEALPDGVKPMDQAAWDARIAQAVRDERYFILKDEVDPIVTNPLRWEELSSGKQQEWRDFRKALLDITDQEGFPHEVSWPTQPE